MELREKAVFGAGCFWCVEAIFEMLEGVESVVSGYAGGTTTRPTYEQVCGGDTGHVEAVEITYDPSKISYQGLLDVFWGTHDPTTLNRQGNDVGSQYRSIIFYGSEEQKRLAEESKKQLEASGKYKNPIVTEIVPLSHFFEAEKEHQDYYRANKKAPYCQIVIVPKLKHVEETFGNKLKKQL